MKAKDIIFAFNVDSTGFARAFEELERKLQLAMEKRIFFNDMFVGYGQCYFDITKSERDRRKFIIHVPNHATITNNYPDINITIPKPIIDPVKIAYLKTCDNYKDNWLIDGTMDHVFHEYTFKLFKQGWEAKTKFENLPGEG